MSSARRNANEINILAMLDRESANPLGRRFVRLRQVASYGGAFLLACGLVGTIAWLVHDASDELPAEAQVVAHAEALPHESDHPALPMALDAAVDAEPARGAAIVNLTAAPAPAAHAPAEAAPVAALPSAAYVPPRTAPDALGAHRPALTPVRVPVPARAHEAPRAAVREQEAKPARPAAPRLAARTAAPGKAAASAAHPETPARGRRSAAAKAGPAQPVDTDVALISAIIQHSGARQDAQAEPGCTDKPCGPRPAARP